MIVVLDSNIDLKVIKKFEIKNLNKKNIKQNKGEISWFFDSQ